jgi:hypothetical protein
VNSGELQVGVLSLKGQVRVKSFLNKAIENLLISCAGDTKLDKLVNDSDSEKQNFK